MTCASSPGAGTAGGGSLNARCPSKEQEIHSATRISAFIDQFSQFSFYSLSP